MKYVISVLVAAAAAMLSAVGLRQDLAQKIKLFRQTDPDETFETKEISKNQMLVLVGISAVAVFFAAWKVMDRTSDPVGVTKMLLAMLCMVGAAWFDYRERRIPNLYPAVLAVGAVVLLATGLIVGQEDAMLYVTTSVVAAIGCVLLLLLASVLTGQGIGPGDIKLVGALALMTGVYAIIGTLFFGVVTCSVYAVVALIRKTKTRNSAVPFGPFLFVGYIITIFANQF